MQETLKTYVVTWLNKDVICEVRAFNIKLAKLVAKRHGIKPTAYATGCYQIRLKKEPKISLYGQQGCP
jgi:hypothetical protein